MGAALAEAAAKRGDHVTAWNRTASKVRALESFGVRCATTVAEAVAGAERMDALIARGFGADDLGVLAIDAVAKAT